MKTRRIDGARGNLSADVVFSRLQVVLSATEECAWRLALHMHACMHGPHILDVVLVAGGEGSSASKSGIVWRLKKGVEARLM
jgi:hypothetical protein